MGRGAAPFSFSLFPFLSSLFSYISMQDAEPSSALTYPSTSPLITLPSLLVYTCPTCCYFPPASTTAAAVRFVRMVSTTPNSTAWVGSKNVSRSITYSRERGREGGREGGKGGWVDRAMYCHWLLLLCLLLLFLLLFLPPCLFLRSYLFDCIQRLWKRRGREGWRKGGMEEGRDGGREGRRK